MKLNKLVFILTTVTVLNAIPITANAEWKQSVDKWSYIQDNGAPITGWRLIDGDWYKFDIHGYMQTGWVFSHSNWYYLDDSGKMVRDTVVDNYMIQHDGTMVDADNNAKINSKIQTIVTGISKDNHTGNTVLNIELTNNSADIFTYRTVDYSIYKQVGNKWLLQDRTVRSDNIGDDVYRLLQSGITTNETLEIKLDTPMTAGKYIISFNDSRLKAVFNIS